MNMNELKHYGIPGMKWGVRRYQNRDGTLTQEGKALKKQVTDDLRDSAKQRMAKQKELKQRIKETSEFVRVGNKIKNETGEAPEYLEMKIHDLKSLQGAYDRGKKYIKLTNAHLDAFANDKIQVGKDYVYGKYNTVKYTKSGNRKMSKINSEHGFR